ncbi:MAG: hypothetical protein HDR30_05455 [Lachnospiraceae bacterium]|nr:hypothetical protein [Lachnospiraceae bacterium]
MGSCNVLVLGNGFDLYHGLKTNYIDFVRFSKELIKSEKGTKGRDWAISNSFIKSFIKVATENQSWIDCEKEIEVIVTMFLKILSDSSVFDAIPNYIKKQFTSLKSYEYERLRLMNKFCEKVSPQTIIFQKRYFKVYQGIDKELIMKTLKKDLNDLINLFKYYLEKNVINQPISRFSKQIESIDPVYIINFNYTNTYEHYGINKKDVCYIHGSVQDDNIVLGIRDIDEKDIDSIYFKKFFQRMQKHTDIIQWDRFIENHGLGSKFNIANTFFFGHSLSNTDGDLLKKIYKNSQKIIIFHLESQKDYEKKIINLIDTLGKESVIQGMYSGKIKFIPIK